MVYVEGVVQPIGIFEISDSLLPFVTSKDALEIHRIVEMRQWKLKHDETGERYKLRWLKHPEMDGDAP